MVLKLLRKQIHVSGNVSCEWGHVLFWCLRWTLHSPASCPSSSPGHREWQLLTGTNKKIILSQAYGCMNVTIPSLLGQKIMDSMFKWTTWSFAAFLNISEFLKNKPQRWNHEGKAELLPKLGSWFPKITSNLFQPVSRRETQSTGDTMVTQCGGEGSARLSRYTLAPPEDTNPLRGIQIRIRQQSLSP